ncbi:GNAT family N-acetyltransferase [Saccharothrix coeruleofusca]|uniref:N-acetyltransferase n=1 Tax=Saccharothrix coeruleofusca TaxID=33919 RepID=A0A918APF2_9PSEU|nr:GNAT family N-acetyltransferase [Saccharothrix coeruleofusca]GGP57664.1 N-acetyltransferase [Saccharothrix coeruleofusca]
MDDLLPPFHDVEARYSLTELSPDELNATWGALRVHSLTWHPDADLDDLLRRWPLSGADDPDTAAVVVVPSRAADAPRTLRAHGFAPSVVIAARRAGRGPARPSEVAVRELTGADVDVVTELNLEVVRYDSRFGMVTERPSSAARLRERVASLLERDRPCAWVAHRGGDVLGALYLDWPGHSDWIADRTSLAPAAYIPMLGVRSEARGTGVGSALVRHVHGLLDGAGVAVTLLHHAPLNPLSTPFWYSHGYRPLWTTWTRSGGRRPAG